ncbi:hypothetical protein PR048_010297 [Dryococelus australis]|uniref:Copia protein n=1 Tax=Dryococelus australis TaxID=614101 RepID=A0ABQ9I2D8_9NEOP|nr:hypothetical protein PR048_010297 [Dryococelus australis]
MVASQHNFPQLSASNFSNWKFRLECLLDERQCKDIMEVKVTEKCKGVSPQYNKELLVKDARARSIIVQCITDQHIEYVKDAKSAFEMTKCLKNKAIMSLKCKMGADLEEHFQQFDRLVRDLEETGSKMDE